MEDNSVKLKSKYEGVYNKNEKIETVGYHVFIDKLKGATKCHCTGII